MGEHDFAGEAQVQTGSFHLPAARTVSPIKAFKDKFAVGWRNGRPSIGNAHQCVIRPRQQLETNQTSNVIVFEGIAGEVLQSLFQNVSVSVDVNVRRNPVLRLCAAMPPKETWTSSRLRRKCRKSVSVLYFCERDWLFKRYRIIQAR